MSVAAKDSKPCCGCKYCGVICSEGAIIISEFKPRLLPDRCNNCELCYYVCPLDCVKEEVFGKRE